MGRRLRSILPCTTNQLIPETVCYHETQPRFLKKQADQKSYYDKSGVQTLQLFKTGEAVRVMQESILSLPIPPGTLPGICMYFFFKCTIPFCRARKALQCTAPGQRNDYNCPALGHTDLLNIDEMA